MPELRNTTALSCPACDWQYWRTSNASPAAAEDTADTICPHCRQAALEPISPEAMDGFPEVALPFAIVDEALRAGMQRFAGGFLFVPRDLKAANLLARLQPLYLPRWLVDSDVQATWQAEMGFDYQVVSHQDQFDEATSAWQSRQVQEGRIRWEERAGRLQRSYQNVPAPAIEEDRQLRTRLGDFTGDSGQPYSAATVENALIRRPNRSQADAWPDATPIIQARASEECRQAAAADHTRNYRWQPEFNSANWTQLLLPLYATWYQDDGGVQRPVLVHGQTGKVYGRRQASVARARKVSLVLGVAAAGVFLFSLLLILIAALGLASQALDGWSVLRGLGVTGVLGAMGLAVLAVAPIAYVWIYNLMQPRDPPLL